MSSTSNLIRCIHHDGSAVFKIAHIKRLPVNCTWTLHKIVHIRFVLAGGYNNKWDRVKRGHRNLLLSVQYCK